MLRRFIALGITVVFSAILTSNTVLAISQEDFDAITKNYIYYEETTGGSCGGAANYANLTELVGEEIIQNIQTLEPVYRELEAETGVPWQFSAALHYREVNTQYTNNPVNNNQGVFQLYHLVVTRGELDFPAGRAISLKDPNEVAGSPSTKQAFKEQLRYALDLIKGAQSRNYERNRRPLSVENAGDDSLIKDYFFSYNGRSAGYKAQAADYGFDPDTEGYEGSPYVMNKADAQRDGMPTVTRDRGGIDGIDSRPGAFVIYKSLSSTAGTTVGEGGGDEDPNVSNALPNVPLSQQAYRGAQEARRLGHTTTIGGTGGRGNQSDHPTGYAIDVMSITPGVKAGGEDKILLDQIAAHFIRNHEQLSVKYVIWYKQVANPRTNWEWENYNHPSGRTDDTALHYDHVHISFTEDEGGGATTGGVCL